MSSLNWIQLGLSTSLQPLNFLKSVNGQLSFKWPRAINLALTPDGKD